MSNRSKWLGVGLLVLAAIVGAQYVRASVRHHASPPGTARIAPEELTAAAGVLPVTVIESYF